MSEIEHKTRPYYTRFNPTVNGALHVGHLYMILVNQAEAHNSGGKFTVRWDDNQEPYRYGVSWTGKRYSEDEIANIRAMMQADIEWFGVFPDAYTSQAEREERVTEFIHHLDHGEMRVRKAYTSQINPELKWDSFDTPYPYVPWLTAEKVINDFLDGTNLLIRGEDLLDEWSLYWYFCDLWGIPAPRQVFLRRLRFTGGGELLDISKTRGRGTIQQYRDEGWTPLQLRAALAEACLKDSQGDWTIANLKVQPEWAY